MAETTQSDIYAVHQQIVGLREKLVDLLKQTFSGPITKEYTFRTQTGSVTLSEMFGDKNDLIVIHNMGKSCKYCTLWADEFNGIQGHLRDRSAFWLVNGDSLETQKEFSSERAWEFPMALDDNTEFTTDMGFMTKADGKHMLQPGYSTFYKNEDGSIERVGSDFFGPGDMYSGTWHFFELLKKGDDGWSPKYKYEN